MSKTQENFNISWVLPHELPMNKLTTHEHSTMKIPNGHEKNFHCINHGMILTFHDIFIGLLLISLILFVIPKLSTSYNYIIIIAMSLNFT